MSNGIGPIANLQGKVNGSNELAVTVSGGISGADGAILDGVSAAIKASVLDLTNNNPLVVAIADGNGDQISSFGGGTQYTEDAAAAADPVGTAQILVRKDTPAATVSADGDNIARRGSNFGAAYATALDSAGAQILGTTTDASVQGDNTGSINARLRGISIVANDVWDSVNHRVKVDGSGVTQPVSGTVAIGASVTPGTAAANLGKAEDAAHSSGDVGVMALTVRQDTAAALAGTDGDYQPPITDASGRLHVNVGTSALPTLASTSTKQSDGSQKTQVVDGSGNVVGSTANALDVNIKSGASAGTQYTEDVAAAADPIGTALIMVRADALSGTTVSADGDNISARSTSKGEQYVKHVDTIGITAASASIASGAIASGAVASGAFASGSIASGAIAAGAIAAGATSIAENEDVGSADGDRGVKVLAVRKGTPANTSGTDGDYEFLQMSAGRIWASANVDQINGVTPLMGAGNTGTGSPRVTIATDQAAMAGFGVYVEDAAETVGGNLVMAGAVRRDTAASSSGTAGDNSTINVDAVGRLWTSGAVVEDAGHTTGDQLVAVATRRIDTPASSAGTSADYATLDQSAEGALWATLTPTTTGGLSTMNASSSDGATALTSTAQAIKGSAGNLYGYFIYNPNAVAVFVQFYNTAQGSVTVGTTNPLFMLTIPAGAAANLSFAYPVAFSTAMSWAATATAGGNGAPTTALDASCWYK